MSKKRAAEESSSNEKTNEDSDPVLFQGENNAKHAKLTPFSDTTMQDLPIEMVECILLRAIAMEVKDMKMAKCAWKEKADLVIDRLRTVCSQWNNILTSNVFRNEVHRILDGTAPKTIHLELLHRVSIPHFACELTTMRDEIFMLCCLCRPGCKWNGKDCVINVFNRNDMAAKVKDVIPLSGIKNPDRITGCSMLNCLYLLSVESDVSSVLRITKDEGHPYKISTWITDLQLGIPILSVSASGSLIILSRSSIQSTLSVEPNSPVANVYHANGFLQHKIVLSRDVYEFRWFEHIMLKPTGNLILLTSGRNCENELFEVDTRGSIVRQYQSRLFDFEISADFADVYGRIFICDEDGKVELLDSELNSLDLAGLQLDKRNFEYPTNMHYNETMNAIVSYSRSASDKSTIVTIVRFTEK